MKPKQPQKKFTTITLEGDWVDIDDLVKPGEQKQLAEGIYVDNTGTVLDPPEPITKPGKKKRRKK